MTNSSRRGARRVAMVLLYQHDVTARPLQELYADYERDARSPVPSYARETVEAVLQETERLDRLIGEHAHDWSVDRISPIERAALRIAVLELTERPEVPAAVAIDEAVGLAKRYASPEAATFVNGILGAVARELGVGR